MSHAHTPQPVDSTAHWFVPLGFLFAGIGLVYGHVLDGVLILHVMIGFRAFWYDTMSKPLVWICIALLIASILVAGYMFFGAPLLESDFPDQAGWWVKVISLGTVISAILTAGPVNEHR